MRTPVARSLELALLVLLLLLATAAPAAAGGGPLATGVDNVAIRGYDTVAYFTDGKAIKGTSTYEYAWDDAKWRFASAAHRDMFAADPDRYMPQFGGFCAGAMMSGIMVPANPKAWAIVDGKLYMVAGGTADIDVWKANAHANIESGNRIWPGLQKRWAVQNQ
jgi:YHS domain